MAYKTITGIFGTKTSMQVLAATAAWYKVQLPDGNIGFVPAANVKNAEKAFTSFNVIVPTNLLEKPDAIAASKTTLNTGEKLEIPGGWNLYYFVNHAGTTGWAMP